MKEKIKDKIIPKNSRVRYYLNLMKQTMKFFKKNGIKKTIEKIKTYDNKSHITNINEYKKWIVNNEPNNDELKKQKDMIFKLMPKISIVVPMYNTKIQYFKELISSLECQTYENWQLCIWDASDEKNEKFEEMIESDKRITYEFANKNEGISKNTNCAIKMACGEYIGFLDHDDILAPFALFEIVKAINENPMIDYIFSDEDKISDNSTERFAPLFKPDFAIDTLRSVNYICHFSVIRKKLLDKLGGISEGVDGAQDYDLILKTSEITNNIKHISKILYHWRANENSTAINIDNDVKPYAYEAGKIAIEKHLKRMNINAKVDYGKYLGTYKINYEVIGNPKISILIPNKDHIKDLENCINSIINLTTYDNYEIVIIENNSSSNKTIKYYNNLIKNKKIKILYYPEKEFNYSKIINYGVRNTSSEYILQLNNDTELITQNWLESFLGYAQRKDVGIVGAKLYYPDETIQHAGIILGINNVAGHILKNLPKNKKAYFGRESFVQNFNAVTGACLFANRKIYEEVNYMDENLKVAFNDVDFCLKVREKGYLVVWNPFIELKHFESKSRGYENTEEKIKRYTNEKEIYQKKWKNVLDVGDEYFNKNFRRDIEDYVINGNKIIN